MYQISKQFDFSASHQLSGLPPTHQCSRLHGHNYTIKVILGAANDGLNEVGFIRDYNELDVVKDYIKRNLDHYHLNDVFDFNPTAENMARHLTRVFKAMIPEVIGCEVSETPKTTATFIDETDTTGKIEDLKDIMQQLSAVMKAAGLPIETTKA